ncbi:MAG: sulfate reduction electron transfer complex DsrMKJOP subunit DsrJ [Gammaproteobacteria bacterium]|nr:MAG: sulfate reduction electron transfer complex DsrMKJOP subunit DsrJ [Gammaproteobacteria bacterium]
MMSFRQFAKHLVVLAGLIALPVLSNAGELGPVQPKAKKKASEKTECVEPVGIMRKNHMKFLLHKRDETLREGVRTKEHSLTECIACHVTPNDKGEFARIGEDGHFCSSCHNYAAVNEDCFDCHSDLPEDAAKKLRSSNNPHQNMLTEGGKK